MTRGGGDGDSVGALTRGGLASPFVTLLLPTVEGFAFASSSESDPSLSESEPLESLELDDEEEEDEDEDEDESEEEDEDAVSLSKSMVVEGPAAGLDFSSSDESSLSEDPPGEYDICLLLLFLAGLLALAADGAAMLCEYEGIDG